MSGGGVIIARSLWDDPAFQNEPFSEREAWVWLICEAAWKPRQKRVGKVIVDLNRGQLAASVRFMAEAFSWHRNKVDRFLKRLEKCNLIRVKSGTGVNVITICKYDDYQLSPKSSGTAAGQQRDSSGTNENKGNKGNKGIYRDTTASLVQSATDRFDEFWQRYPRKVGKGAAQKAYAKAVKKVQHDDLMFALSQQIPAMEAKEQQYRPHAATWLNAERWTDEPEQPDHNPRGHPSADTTAQQIAFAAAARRTPREDCF